MGKSENNNTINYLEELHLETLDFFPINTFQPGSCLFWSIILAYLVSLKSDKETFDEIETDMSFYLGCSVLFGQISDEDKNKLQELINQFQVTQDLTFIYRSPLFQKLILLFRQRVVGYIKQHRREFQGDINIDFDNYICSMEKENRFAGKLEIEAMVVLLNCSIEVVDIKEIRKSYVLFPLDDPTLESKSLIKVRDLRLFFDSTKDYYYFGFKKIKIQKKLDFIPDKIILSKKECTKEIDVQNFQSLIRIDVPRDNSCLFWAAALGYLVSMGSEQFEKSCEKLFGSFRVKDLDDIKEQIINFNLGSVKIIQANKIFVDLVREKFRHKIVHYMLLHRDDFDFETDNVDSYLREMLALDSWGGLEEVKAISAFLQCKIYLFTRWDTKLQDPLKIGTGEPKLYLFYDDEQAHYYLELSKEKIKDYANRYTKEFLNDNRNKNALSQMITKKKDKKIYTKLFNKQVKLKPNLWNDLVMGMSVGLFLELFLRLFTAMPIVKFSICAKDDLYQKLNFSLMEHPYSYLQNYQEFLLKPTELDIFLDKFLAKKRLFTVGILSGSVGGLMKYLINTEDKDKFLIMMGIFFAILPLDYFFSEENNKELEKLQMSFRCVLMLFSSLQGFLNVISFSASSVKKISSGITYFIEKTKQFSSFFTKKTAESETMNSEASLQYSIGASR